MEGGVGLGTRMTSGNWISGEDSCCLRDPCGREGEEERTLALPFLLLSNFLPGCLLADSSWKLQPEGIPETEMPPERGQLPM